MTEGRDGNMSLDVAEDRKPGSARKPLFKGPLPLAAKAAIATLILIAIGAGVAPSSISASAFLSLLPFVAILAVASIGQHLVVQQRGLDISISGVICFSAVIVTKLPPTQASGGSVAFWVLAALAMGLAAGAVTGAVVTFLRVPPLVTTIGMNAVLIGLTLIVSGSVPSQAPPLLAGLALGITLGVPNTIWIALILVAITVFVVDRTVIGRRFVAVSVSPAAAHAIGIPVEIYRVGTYMAAGLSYAAAGVLLAGFLSVPSIFCGNAYILASVAAVVVGGNSIAGGAKGSLIATVIGAFFLTFLSQLVLSAGLERSMQNVVQAVIVIGGVALPEALKWLRMRGAAPAAAVQAASVAEPTPGAILEFRDLRKNFGPVQALRGANLAVYPGEVHAVVGENGAGKSTLINIASGVLSANGGEMRLRGEVLGAEPPLRRRQRGLAVAYQHPALAPDLSVLENLQLVAPDLTAADVAALIAAAATPHLRMDPRQRVETLSLAQLHVVEIARAIATKPAILILDEPTEPFQQADVQHLFAMIRSLRDSGVAVIYVSHRLHEVRELADRISIMRDGEIVESRKASEIGIEEIVTLIAGRPLGQVFPQKAGAAGAPVLEAQTLGGAGFHEVSLSVGAGEIVGLAGVEGEGQREFLRALAGVEPHRAGEIAVRGARISGRTPGAYRAAGVGFVSDDRHGEGLFLNLTLRENVGVRILRAISRALVLRPAAERAAASDVREQMRVRASSVETTLATLSGGNQQKVLFGREIAAAPAVLLVDEPTKGVDIGSRMEIYQKLRALAQSGVAVVVSSSDGVELEGLCDRVLIFARGSVVRELRGEDVTDVRITEANLTATASRAADARAARKSGGWLRSDHFPALVLAVITAGVLLLTNAYSEYFLSAFNIAQMLNLLAILALLAVAQFAVIMVGGIDLSVGPLAGFIVVLASFILPAKADAATLLGGGALALAFGAAYGLAQGWLVTALRLPSIVVTLASFIGLQGVSLLLRPRPKGTISNDVSDFFANPWLGVPLAMVLALIAVLIFEFVLYRAAAGRRLRAVGSNPLASARVGVNGARVTLAAFTLSGLLSGVAGLMLAGQIGIGSGTTGVDFSLMSITAVVLGGVSVTGGRGSAIGVLLGAALVQAMSSASSFLNADSSLQYSLVGAITLIAACLFSAARGRGAAHAH
jgi:ribose transport system ATP-binding protein